MNSTGKRIITLVTLTGLLAMAAPKLWAAPEPAADAAAQTRTLNFKDANLEQVLAVYKDLSQRVILPAPGLDCRITMQSGEIRLSTEECLIALDTMLELHNIKIVKCGDHISKAIPAQSYTDVVFGVYQVKHASASLLAATLLNTLQIWLNIRGEAAVKVGVIPDERSNQLLIIARNEDHDFAKMLLGKLDIPVEQPPSRTDNQPDGK